MRSPKRFMANTPDIDLHWFALYTKPRHEKKVSEKLNALGIEAYCPTIIQKKQWSDRVKKVETPLISSYVFVHCTDAQRPEVFRIDGPLYYLYYIGRPAVVRDAEIALLKGSLTDSILSYDVEHYRAGQSIELPKGPFKGQTGKINSVSKNRVEIAIEELGIKLILDRE